VVNLAQSLSKTGYGQYLLNRFNKWHLLQPQ
jgi:hypothetical protein